MGNCVGCEANSQLAVKEVKKNAAVIDKVTVPGSKSLEKAKSSFSVIGRPSEDFHGLFNIGKEISRDHFGITYVCTERVTGNLFAVKSVAKRKLLTKDDVEDLRREISILNHLSGHPNVTRFHDSYEDKHSVYIVMELNTGGELFDRIVDKGHYSEKQAAALIRGVLEGVQHCQSLGVIHRDLNPENILLASKNGGAEVKISGFSQGQFYKEGQYFADIVGSPFYIAPEVLRCKYGPEADVWSCGVILYILLTGNPPFWAEHEQGVFDSILRGQIDFFSEPWPSISHGAKDLIKKILVQDPRERLTIAQILSHEWMKADGSASDKPLDATVLANLTRFSNMNKMKKVALKVISSSLSEEKIADLKAIFSAVDTDNSGSITYDELKEGLRRHGHQIPEFQIKELMEAADLDHSGTIDYEEFVTATMRVNKAEMEDNLQNAFNYFDKDGSGLISHEELRQALSAEGILKPGEIEAIIAEVDTDNDGSIDYNEFCEMMTKSDAKLAGQS